MRFNAPALTTLVLAATCAAQICVVHESQILTESDGTQRNGFGGSIALHENWLAVGARGAYGPLGSSSGRVYLLRRTSSNTENAVDWWLETQTLVPEGLGGGDTFGVVSMTDDWIAAGAPGDDDAGSHSGSLYLYRRDRHGTDRDEGDDTWLQHGKLTATDAVEMAAFGNAVAMTDDAIVVGAPYRDEYAGAAYLFRRDDAGTPNETQDDSWWQQARLLASDVAPNDRFGAAVAVDGRWVVVGSRLDDDDGNASGSAYVFQIHEFGTSKTGNAESLTETQKLRASDAAPGDLFGVSVAVGSSWLFVGSTEDDDTVGVSGSVYTFRLDKGADGNDPSDDRWKEFAKLHASDPALVGRFGKTISVDGNRVLIGADHGAGDPFKAGAAYVFQRLDHGTPDDGSDDNWFEMNKFVASAQEDRGGLGADLAIEDATIMAGVPGYNEGDELGVGAVLVFDLREFESSDSDCNENALPDACEPDCNANGIPDECDLADETSVDCQDNGLPDECEPDCNRNLIPDDCDVAMGAPDVNDNLRPDECDPPNDYCSSALPLFPGDTLYSAVGATIDGPPMEWQCGLICDPWPCYVEDIWYEFTSTAGGFVEIVAEPEEGYIWGVAAYHGCDCPVALSESVGCDLWGWGLTFEAEPAQCYKIQVGASEVTGVLRVHTENPQVVDCSGRSNVSYVDARAKDGGNGSDWPTALQSLQSALTVAASPDNETVEIRMAGGSYSPFVGGAGREATFELPACVTIKGGFAGLGAPDPNLRNTSLYETVLNGASPVKADESAYHVVTARDVDERTVLDGVTITGGEATGTSPHDQGGGVFCERAAPTLRNVRIVGNRAQRGGGGVYNCDGIIAISEVAYNSVVFGSGGGLKECDGEISESRIVGNSARQGGGLYDCDGVVARCDILENMASVSGGGVSESDLFISHCYVSGNRSGNTGGAFYGCDATIRDSVVSGNYAVIDGGAFSYCDGPIRNCTVTGNDVSAIGTGGALSHCNGGILSSIFFDNAVPWLSYSTLPTYSCTPPGGPLPTSVSTDPGFRLSGYRDESGAWIEGDYRLRTSSPCIDIGPSYVPQSRFPTDLDGHARVLCTGVDAGAYESGAGDLDCNRTVNLFDWAHWPMCMNGPSGTMYESACEAFDFDYDGDVDLHDGSAHLAVFMDD